MNPGEILAERFEIERLAGTGGMGDVYRAKDRQTGDVVALKVLHGPGARYAPRFAREAQLLAELSHPAIVRYIAHGQTTGGQLYLAMEWLEGIDLARQLAKQGLTVEESVTLAKRAADALGLAHEHGIIHRDVKPSNLLLCEGDVAKVKLLDFGIARLTDGTATLTGVTFGTPGYMAPEQARGDRQLDATADVFALGCVLFECLTGRAAFAGENVMAILAKIVLADAPRVRELRPEVPRALDNLVARMLAKNPDDRPRDGKQVAAEIAALGPLVGVPLSGSMAPESSLTPGEQKLLCVVLAGSPHPPDSTMRFAAVELSAALPDPGAVAKPAAGAGAAPARVAPGAASVEVAPGTSPSVGVAPGPAAARIGTARPPPLGTETLARIRGVVELCDAHVELLADGSVIATLTGGRSATDQAAQAARVALAMRGQLAEAPVVIATGRGVLSGRLPVGEAIDRAVALLRVATDADAAPPSTSRPGVGRKVRIDDTTAGLLDARFDLGGDGQGLFLRGERDGPDTGRTLLGRTTPTVGRDRELATLLALFDESSGEGCAHAVLLTAAAGLGKSRLAQELVRTIRERRARVEIWSGRAEPVGTASAFGLLASALRRAAGVVAGEPLAVRQKKLAARVQRHVEGPDAPRITQFLGELAGVPFPDDDSVQLRAARHDAMLMGDQIRRAWEDFLAVECTAQPVLLVLEDLQWGDLPSVRLVDAALRLLKHQPLMVLAMARPEVHDTFPKLWSERRVQEIALGELSPKACERLARHVLGGKASDATIGALVTRADGNALYLEELIRATADGRSGSAPATVLAMVQARLEGLGAQERWVLRAASVFGEAFWKGGVAVLLGGADAGVPLERCLAELVEREVVDRKPASRFEGEDEYRFHHGLVREAAHAMLTDADRALGHKMAGEWLERAGETDAIVLAEHYDRGGEPSRAVAWYRRAAAQALEGNDLAVVVRRVERGLSCGAAGVELGALLLLGAEAHRWRGEHAEAHEHARRAMDVLPRGSARWYAAASELALATVRLASYEPLLALVDELERPPPDPGVTRRYVVALGRAAVALYYGGRNEHADRLFAQIERHEGAIGTHDPAALAVVHRVRATRAVGTGDPGAYLVGMEAAAACFEQAGDLRNACNARVNTGHANMELGAFGRAERALRAALTTAERMGLPAVSALAKHNLGLTLARRGAVEPGREFEVEALEAFAHQGDRRLEGGSRVYLAVILALGERWDEAEREACAAVELVGSIFGLKAYALGVLAEIRLDNGGDALTPAREAADLVEKLGGLEEGESLVRLSLARALEAAGERVAARDAIRTARARLMARAEKIRDPLWRASFLDRVPENAKTLELYKAIGDEAPAGGRAAEPVAKS